MAYPQPSAAGFENFHSVLSLQELIKKPMVEIPPRYVFRSDDEETLNCHSFSTIIPTFDFKLLLSKETSDLEIEKLHSICKEWGIFQLVNHGVSSIMAKLNHEIEEFYKLPLEEKMKYKIRPGEFEGYGTISRMKGTLDWGDRFYMITNPITRRKPHLFPELPSSLRDSLESYLSEMQKIAMKLLEFLAQALNIDKKEMEELFDNGMQSMRMSYYPPCPQPELVVGITPHSDATGITILSQVNEVDGFQIKKDGVWMPVSFVPYALVVNLGDILQILSNGVYQSIEHRVTVNSEKERMSIAFFCNPKFEVEIGPAPSLINSQNPPQYRRIGMEDYVKGYFSQKLNRKSYLEKMKLQHEELVLEEKLDSN
ncbi:Flavonol synthase/flavanone 3-hydroxylase, putative [Ricinus communis]|uniref:Flavonol synthase/flavanone 3-hydroxylase, putative n=1 Tax=Ricinus communis TaxID=3988 RepID=B9S1A1_RICCO|nr:Flavonol synthase/flavanone 3-hydroxylase, putative [Ricinus communis]|eukprot:XP_002519770.1 protein SRG1 [Ricinus communis]